METNIDRKIALLQALNVPFIVYNGEEYVADLDEFNEANETDYTDGDNIDDPIALKAFKKWLEECPVVSDEVEEFHENTFEYDGAEYLVVTDNEADDLWEQDLDNYLEECVYPGLTGNLASYFDDEKWKRDAKMNGRAHSLNRYDDYELETTVNEEVYYIYRTN